MHFRLFGSMRRLPTLKSYPRIFLNPVPPQFEGAREKFMREFLSHYPRLSLHSHLRNGISHGGIFLDHPDMSTEIIAFYQQLLQQKIPVLLVATVHPHGTLRDKLLFNPDSRVIKLSNLTLNSGVVQGFIGKVTNHYHVMRDIEDEEGLVRSFVV